MRHEQKNEGVSFAVSAAWSAKWNAMKQLVDRIGIAGIAAIALLAAALLFSNFVVRPLEAGTACWSRPRRAGRKADAALPGEKVAAVHAYLQKDEATTDWLAKLHGIGAATGLQLRSASYKTLPAEGRIVRYEIVLPVSGSYGQIRDFLKRAHRDPGDVGRPAQPEAGAERSQRHAGAPGRVAPHSAHGEVMNLRFNLSPWKKNAAIVAAAVTVVAGVVAGRERPAIELIQEKSANRVADDGIDLAKPPPEATVPQSDPFARNFGAQKPAKSRECGGKDGGADGAAVPFRYFGRLTENGKTEVFVMRGDDLLTISAGQKIGEYRVEQIADAAISFTFRSR